MENKTDLPPVRVDSSKRINAGKEVVYTEVVSQHKDQIINSLHNENWIFLNKNSVSGHSHNEAVCKPKTKFAGDSISDFSIENLFQMNSAVTQHQQGELLGHSLASSSCHSERSVARVNCFSCEEQINRSNDLFFQNSLEISKGNGVEETFPSTSNDSNECEIVTKTHLIEADFELNYSVKSCLLEIIDNIEIEALLEKELNELVVTMLDTIEHSHQVDEQTSKLMQDILNKIEEAVPQINILRKNQNGQHKHFNEIDFVKELKEKCIKNTKVNLDVSQKEIFPIEMVIECRPINSNKAIQMSKLCFRQVDKILAAFNVLFKRRAN